jgi:hypothetical protein
LQLTLEVIHNSQSDTGEHSEPQGQVYIAERRKSCVPRQFFGDTKHLRAGLAHTFVKDTEEPHSEQNNPRIDDGTTAEGSRQTFN